MNHPKDSQEKRDRVNQIVDQRVDHDRGKKRLNLADLDEDAKKKKLAQLFEKRIPKPHFVRANDYKRLYGQNYILRRNEFGSAVYVVGKAYRRLPTAIDVDIALKNNKQVAQWGNKFFLYTKIGAEMARPILEDIWASEVKRGIPIPEYSDYDKDEFSI